MLAITGPVRMVHAISVRIKFQRELFMFHLLLFQVAAGHVQQVFFSHLEFVHFAPTINRSKLRLFIPALTASPTAANGNAQHQDITVKTTDAFYAIILYHLTHSTSVMNRHLLLAHGNVPPDTT